MNYCVFLLLGTAFLGGCASIGNSLSIRDFEQSLGESTSAYSYIPIDPFSVKEGKGSSCSDGNNTPMKMPEAFPDNNVRIAYKTIDLNGNVSFGPIKTTQAGNRYQIIIDFINVDVVNEKFFVKKFILINEGKERKQVEVFARDTTGATEGSTGFYAISRHNNVPRPGNSGQPSPERKNGEVVTPTEVNVPVYVGVGLRVTADVVAIEGNSNLSGLDVISAAAENGQVTGSLTVQTLGINGKSISAALPIQSELNRTTVQNAIASLGAIKALMYEDGVRIEPRVVGIYNPIGGGEDVVNAIISELSSERVTWMRPCGNLDNSNTAG
jgi:hypothetical protein